MSGPKLPGPAFEIPDLEPAPPVSKRAPQPPPGRTPSTLSSNTAAFGLEIALPEDDDDDFELIQTGSNVELSVGASPQATRRHLEQGNWPTGRTRPADQLPIDSAEVALIAGYGNAPNNALLAPVYAYRVLARRGPLKRAIAEHHAALVQAELARDTQLMQLATELRPVLEANEGFRRLLEPIREVERVATERNAALSEADAGYHEQMARFDAELAQLAEAVTNARAIYDHRRANAEGTEQELRRAEAKHQRVQIEIRGVMDIARQALGPAGGDMPPAEAARLAELQARATALEPELLRARSAHAAARSLQDQAQADLRRVQNQVGQVEREKGSAGSSLEKQLTARVAGVSEAEEQRRSALAEVARAALATRGGVAVPEPLLQALRGHDQTVDAQATRHETHVRALDSHDRERVKQGVILVLSAAGIVLLSILAKAML
jgi:hypothetical protein